MERIFDEDVKTMSDFDLKDIVINRNKYVGKLINAAKKEIEKRGIELTDSELKQIETIKKAKVEKVEKVENIDGTKGFFGRLSENIVLDKSAPKLYTRKILYIFSILFSTFFSGIMFSMNLYQLKKNKYIAVVLLYTFAYSRIMFYVLKKFDIQFLFPVFSLIGYFPIDYFFWDRWIGDLKYRKRKYTILLIIILMILTILAIIHLKTKK